jgi:hypothetical protein
MPAPAARSRWTSCDGVPDVELTATAVQRIEALIETHDLPVDTPKRVAASLAAAELSAGGRALSGGWERLRLLVGLWSWMLIVYTYDERLNRVTVVTVQDARMGSSATTLEP